MDKSGSQRSGSAAVGTGLSKPSSSFAGIVASVEAELARDLARLTSAAWDVAATQAKLAGRTPALGKAEVSAATVPAPPRWNDFSELDVLDAGMTGGTVVDPSAPLGVESDVRPRSREINPPRAEFRPRLSDHLRTGTASAQRPRNGRGVDSHGGTETGGTATPAWPQKTVDRIQNEINQARDVLKSLQDKSTDSSPTNGDVEHRSRMLDQRATELRERVRRAQEALDQQANKLRTALSVEREKLRAYHVKLKNKAKQLEEAGRRQSGVALEEMERELARRSAEIESSVQARIAQLQREIENRQQRVEERERALARREAELQETLSSRLASLKHEAETWDQRYVAKDRELRDREASLDATAQSRLLDIEREAAAKEAEYESKRLSLLQHEEQLERAFDARLAKLESEYTARKIDLEREAKGLADREAALAQGEAARRAQLERESSVRRAEVEAHERSVSAREAQLQEVVAARLEEVKHRAAARDAELAEKEKSLQERESELQRALTARLTEIKRSQEGQSAEFEARLKALEQREREFEQRSQRLNYEVEARAQAVASAESELKVRRESVEARTAELERAMRQHAEQQAEFAALSGRAEGIQRREDELNRLAAGLAGREQSFGEREKRTAADETRLESLRHELDAKRQDIERSERVIHELRGVLARDREDIQRREEKLKASAAESEQREAAIRERSEELQKLRRSVVEKADRVAEEAQWYAQVEEKAQEIERLREALSRRAAEMDRSERALSQREQEVEARTRELDASFSQVQAVGAEVDARRKELAAEEARVLGLVTQATEAERRCEESRRLQTEQLEALQRKQDEITRGEAELFKAQASVESRERAMGAQAETLRVERLSLEELRDSLARKQAAVERTRQELADESAALARQRAELTERHGEAEADRAKLERDLIALRDRDRLLAEEKTRLETAQKDIAEQRAQLATQTAEIESFRRQLMEKAERLKAKKLKLAEAAGPIEAKIRQVNAELEAATEDRARLNDDRERVRELLEQATRERDELERLRKELESRSDRVDHDLAASQARERALEEREERLNERANQLEAFGIRLKQEHTQLQRQRQELTETERRGDEEEAVAVVLQQVEEREQILRQRENEIRAREKSLTTKTAQVTGLEEELNRLQHQLNERARDVEYRQKALDRQRSEFTTAIEEERTEIERSRRQAEEQFAAREERVARMEHEIETEARAFRERADEENTAAEEQMLASLQKKAEGDLSERFAELSRREQEFEENCRRRLAEVDRDVERRLTELATESKSRREEFEKEITRRREKLETEMRDGRARLARESDALAGLREQIVHDAQEKSLAAIPVAQPAGRIGDSSIDLEPEPEVGPVPAADEDRIWLAETDDASVSEAPFIEESDLEFVRDLGIQEQTQPPVAVKAAATQVRKAPRKGSSWGRFAAIFLAAIITGAVAGSLYLWSPAREIVQRGRILVRGDGAGSMSVREHAAAILAPAILDEAGKRLGADLREQHRKQRLFVADSPKGNVVEIMAKVPPGLEKAGQGWIEAIASSYEESLGRMVSSQEAIDERISKLEQDLRTKTQQVAALREEIATLESERAQCAATTDRTQITKRKEELRDRVAKSLAAVTAAKQALADAETEPEISGPLVPTEAELQSVFEKDTELTQAIAERRSKARELHATLLEAMEKSNPSFAELIGTIDAMTTEVQRQVKEQSEKEIKQDLAPIGVHLSDYLEQARRFEGGWAALLPKVKSWQPGSDPEMLIEYQKQAEKLIREFHGESKVSFGEAARKADAIGRAGGEMTKRHVLQSSLTRLAHAALDARNTWTLTVRGVLPRYNVELKALSAAVQDLGPRIRDKENLHRHELEQGLVDRRKAAHRARVESLRTQAEAATREHQKLSEEFLRIDSAADIDEHSAAALAKLQGQIVDRQREAALTQQSIGEIEREISRVRESRQLAKAGSVRYEPMEAFVPPALNLERGRQAILLGLVVSVLFVIGVWVLTRRKTPAVAST